MRSAHRYLCGVPAACCCGGNIPVNKESHRGHQSPEDAFACHKRYLISLCFKPLSSRELEGPDGYIRVLTRPSKFGARARGGKNEGPNGARKTFQHRTGGTVVSV